MRNMLILLTVSLTIVLNNGCGVFDSAIGGVGSVHTTRFVLDPPSDGVPRDRDRALTRDQDIVLESVRAVARAHDFLDTTPTTGGEPTLIAQFETNPPFPLFLSVFEVDDQLSVRLRQYDDSRKKTPLYNEVEVALSEKLTNYFAGRLEVRPQQRQLRYPW